MKLELGKFWEFLRKRLDIDSGQVYGNASAMNERKEVLPEITTVEECNALLQQDLSIIFKHSPTCMVSLYAHGTVSRFRLENPHVPIHLVSVRRHRALSIYIQERTGIEHESPQILILQNGKVKASASHGKITANLLRAALVIANQGSGGSQGVLARPASNTPCKSCDESRAENTSAVLPRNP